MRNEKIKTPEISRGFFIVFDKYVMTFKEFLNGSLFDTGQISKPTVVPKRGTTVGRALSAGKVKSPSRPVGIHSLSKPMIISSVLK